MDLITCFFFPSTIFSDFFVKSSLNHRSQKIKTDIGNEVLVLPRVSFKSSFKLTHFSHILISEKLHVDFFCSLKLKTFPLASRVPKKILLIDYRLGSKLKPNYSSTHVRYCTFNRVIVSVGRVPRYTDTVVHSHPRFTP